jgi:hypothetical protein
MTRQTAPLTQNVRLRCDHAGLNFTEAILGRCYYESSSFSTRDNRQTAMWMSVANRQVLFFLRPTARPKRDLLLCVARHPAVIEMRPSLKHEAPGISVSRVEPSGVFLSRFSLSSSRSLGRCLLLGQRSRMNFLSHHIHCASNCIRFLVICLMRVYCIRKGRGRAESRLRTEAAYVGREVGGISLTMAAKSGTGSEYDIVGAQAIGG